MSNSIDKSMITFLSSTVGQVARTIGGKDKSTLYPIDYKVSGSAFQTTGSMISGQKVLTVPDVGDFEVGQGIIVAGAGGQREYRNPSLEIPSSNGLRDCLEYMCFVIEKEPVKPGVVTIKNIPGVGNRTYDIACTKEKATLVIDPTMSILADGDVALYFDGREHLVPMKAGWTPADIAVAIRNYWVPDWFNNPTETGLTINWTAEIPGPKGICEAYPNGTGCLVTMTVEKGTITNPKDLANAMKADFLTTPFSNVFLKSEITYAFSNVAYLLSYIPGYRGMDKVTVDVSDTGMTIRINNAQYGNSLIAKITDIGNNTITLDTPAAAAVTGVPVLHDDTIALQQMVTDAVGRSIFLPSGLYRISDSLYLTSANNGITIEGAGRGTSILQSYGYSHHGFHCRTGTEDVTFRNFMIRDVSAPDMYLGQKLEVAGIKLWGTRYIHIEDMIIDRCDDSAVSSAYDDTRRTETTNLKAGPPSRFTSISRCEITNTSQGSGLELIVALDATIMDNVVRNSSQHNIRVCGAKRARIIGNFLENGQHGIDFQGFGGSFPVGHTGGGTTQGTFIYAEDVVCTGNTCYQNYGEAMLFHSQVRTLQIHSNSIIGRYITGNNYGIFFTTGSSSQDYQAGNPTHPEYDNFLRVRNTNREISIKDNIITGFSQLIRIQGDQSNILIEGNMLLGPTHYNAPGFGSGYCIYILVGGNGDQKNITIRNNDFYGYSYDTIGIRVFNQYSNLSQWDVMHNRFNMRLSQSRIDDHNIDDADNALFGSSELAKFRRSPDDGPDRITRPITQPTVSVFGEGSQLVAGTYYVAFSWVTQAGETLAGPERSLTILDGQPINVSIPIVYPAGVVGANVYMGLTSGALTKQAFIVGLNYTQMAALETAIPEPTVNTAGIPDVNNSPNLNAFGTGTQLAAGTYYVTYSWVTPYGETTVSPERIVTIGAGRPLNITFEDAMPEGVIGLNVYIGTDNTNATKQLFLTTKHHYHTKAIDTTSGKRKPTVKNTAVPDTNIYNLILKD